MNPLPPWTKSVPPESGTALLDLAEPGIPVAEWTVRAKVALQQGGADRREEVLRLTRSVFLDVENGRLAATPFLGLFRGGSPRLRRQLFFARWATSTAWCRVAAVEVVHPHLAALEAPLAPEGAGEISFAFLRDFVRDRLGPGAGEPSVKRTTSALAGAFCGLGSLERLDGGGKVLAPRRTVPDALAFGWLVRRQLEAERRTEALEEWAATRSDAALLFATEEVVARRLLDEAVVQGLLVRGYLAGAGRLQLPDASLAGPGGGG